MTVAPPTNSRPKTLRLLGAVGLLGLTAQAAVLVIAPIVRPDISLLRDGLSHYAVGPGSGLQSMGFIALGIACAAIGTGLFVVSTATRAAGFLLAAAALGLFGLAIFPMGQGGPMTPIGDLHLTAGTMAAVLQFAAALVMLLSPGACAALDLSRRTGMVLAGIAGLAAAGIQLAIWNPGWNLPEGLLARIAIVPLLLWWAMVALGLRRSGQPTVR
jgi:hypothetical protein